MPTFGVADVRAENTPEPKLKTSNMNSANKAHRPMLGRVDNTTHARHAALTVDTLRRQMEALQSQ